MFRALGRPGIVLVTEGPHSRVNSLVNTEKKHLNRVAPGVPVHVIETGHDEGQVELKDVVKTMNKLPKALTQQEMQVVSGRLSTLNTMRNPMNGLPKGVDPMRARPDRRAMRGR
ncbi:integral membrane protein [Mycobacterium tuberculosis]|nr:integral membrane protein [Mycobacterium tuberculosis]